MQAQLSNHVTPGFARGNSSCPATHSPRQSPARARKGVPCARCMSPFSMKNCRSRSPRASGSARSTCSAARGPAPRHMLCHRNPDPDEAARRTRRSATSASRPWSSIAPSRRSPARASTPGSRAICSPRCRTRSPARQPGPRRRGATLAATKTWMCGTASGRPTPRCSATRSGTTRRARWTVMAHNVESLIWRRYAEAEGNPVKRWYIRRQWSKFERFEQWAYRSATTPIAVSHDDAADARAVRRPARGGRRERRRCRLLPAAARRGPRPGERALPRQPRLAAEPRRRDDPARRHLPARCARQIPTRRSRWSAAPAGVAAGEGRGHARGRVHADVPDVRPFLARRGCSRCRCASAAGRG